MPGLIHLMHPTREQMAAFERYVHTVFPSASFARWMAWGEWNEDYRAVALVDGDEIIANVSLTRMHLLLEGCLRSAWQLGAVGVVPAWRGRGLSRQVMDAALAVTDDDPVLLFANPKVRDFYPRFGFVPCQSATFMANYTCEPSANPAPTLFGDDAATRALIHHLAESGLSSTRCFGARGYGRIATWYLANGLVPDPRQLDDHTLVFSRVEADCLVIDDILAAQSFDLRAAIPRLIDSPVCRIRFGFTPDVWWPEGCTASVDEEADLFMRGLSPVQPHCFPVLAHT